MANNDVKWIKIVTDIFDDEKILFIEQLPEADSIIVIWFKILTLSGKVNNGGVLIFNETMAYTDEMLATLFRRNINTVRLALETFRKFGMIDIIENTITIPNWSKHQSLEQLEERKEYMRNYMKEYREKQKKLALGDCKVNSKVNSKVNGKANSKANVNSLEVEVEEEREEERDKDKSKNSLCKYSDEHLRLSEKLKFNLINDFPKEMAKVDVTKWADVFRLMEERDSITIEKIEYVIDWLPSNSFWATNIRSPKKLREQFERLVVEIKNSINKGKSKGYSQSSRKETLPDWADKEIVETPVSEDEKAAFEQQLRKLGVQKE